MSLAIIGIGLCNEKDITVRGLELVRGADVVYLENYTSLLQCSVSDLEEFYGKKIILSDRAMSEQGVGKILDEAVSRKVVFLVIGDGMSATTHSDIWKEAVEKEVSVEVVGNASVLTAVGITGLQLYKFGKTTSIPYLDEHPELVTPYMVLAENLKMDLHTLCLLDIKADVGRFMTVAEGITVLEDIEKREGGGIVSDDLFVVACARLGCSDFVVRSGRLADVKKIDFGKQPHCLIIPGKMHFLEEEILEVHNKR